MSFHLFGVITEGAYKLSPSDAEHLRTLVLSYAQSRQFMRKSLLAKNTMITQHFFLILNECEFVGSYAGGAVGYIQLVSVKKGEKNPFILRFALQLNRGLGNLWGLIPTKVAMRHELLHIVREAESVYRRNISLFKAEKESPNPIGKLILMLREETYVWIRTLIW